MAGQHEDMMRSFYDEVLSGGDLTPQQMRQWLAP